MLRLEAGFAMTFERRRAVVDRIFAEAAARNQPIDDHPSFLEWIEEWVRGEIDTDVLRARYSALKTDQRTERQRKREERLAALGVVLPLSLKKPPANVPSRNPAGPTLEQVLNEMGWTPDDE
jgi:hypothetical protein